MALMTIFTCLKAVTPDEEGGHIACSQLNALQSWKVMEPNVEIIIMGNSPGSKGLARELGFNHIPYAKTAGEGSKGGIGGLELVSEMFYVAWIYGKTEMYCYCNADIILPPTFCDVVASIDCENYLGVGHRWNLPQQEVHPLDFETGWWSNLVRQARQTGAQHAPSGMDYFVHKRRFVEDGAIPNLFIGRWYWDNVMLKVARDRRIPIINMTSGVFAIHQNHPSSYTGFDPESLANQAKLEGTRPLSIQDADFTLAPAKFESNSW